MTLCDQGRVRCRRRLVRPLPKQSANSSPVHAAILCTGAMVPRRNQTCKQTQVPRSAGFAITFPSAHRRTSRFAFVTFSSPASATNHPPWPWRRVRSQARSACATSALSFCCTADSLTCVTNRANWTRGAAGRRGDGRRRHPQRSLFCFDRRKRTIKLLKQLPITLRKLQRSCRRQRQPVVRNGLQTPWRP